VICVDYLKALFVVSV